MGEILSVEEGCRACRDGQVRGRSSMVPCPGCRGDRAEVEALRRERDAMREALTSIAVMRQEWDDDDHPEFDWRLLARRMEAVARAALSAPEDDAMFRLLASHEALRRRLAEVEAERDTYRTAHISTESALHAARGRLAEVEEALLDAKGALDKTLTVLLTVKPNLDRPYPDAPALTPWTRWCEPLARRVDGARRSVRAVLDKGEHE